MNRSNIKIIKGIFSFPISYLIVFYAFKNAFMGDAPDSMSDEEAGAAASFFSFFITFPFALILSLIFANTRIYIRGIDKKKVKKYLKYSLATIILGYFTIYHPFWVMLGFCSLINVIYFLAVLFFVILAYLSIGYLFPENSIIGKIFTFSVMGFIGFDLFDGDFDSGEADFSGTEVQTPESSGVETSSSGASFEDTGVTEASQEVPIDLDGDGEIDGFDVDGDGNIDVNVVSVEVPDTEQVEGYIREDGTLVSPYVRTTADSIAVNNLEPMG